MWGHGAPPIFPSVVRTWRPRPRPPPHAPVAGCASSGACAQRGRQLRHWACASAAAEGPRGRAGAAGPAAPPPPSGRPPLSPGLWLLRPVTRPAPRGRVAGEDRAAGRGSGRPSPALRRPESAAGCGARRWRGSRRQRGQGTVRDPGPPGSGTRWPVGTARHIPGVGRAEAMVCDSMYAPRQRGLSGPPRPSQGRVGTGGTAARSAAAARTPCWNGATGPKAALTHVSLSPPQDSHPRNPRSWGPVPTFLRLLRGHCLVGVQIIYS